NPAVLEYYAQPCLLKLELIDDETGEVKLVDHTPDFLVVTKEEVILEEWKTEASLLHLARKFPWRYTKEAGSWRRPQIEEAMARIGIVYKVRSNAEIHPNKTKNLEILEDYMHVDVRPCHEHIVDRLKAALAEHGRLSLGDLHGPPFNFSPDVLNQAIVYGDVACDLDAALLSKPHDFLLYRDHTVLEFDRAQWQSTSHDEALAFSFELSPNARFRYDGRVLVLKVMGERELIFSDEVSRKEVGLGRQW